VGHHLGYANAVQGKMNDSQSSLLRVGGVGCTVPGMFMQAILGEEESNYAAHKQQAEAECQR